MKKVIRIAKTTVLTAQICGQVTDIKLYEKINVAEVHMKHNGTVEHFSVYLAADDMLFVTLLGAGDMNDDTTWTRFGDYAGWCHFCGSIGEVANDTEVAEEFCDSVEMCIEQVWKAQRISEILNAVK